MIKRFFSFMLFGVLCSLSAFADEPWGIHLSAGTVTDEFLWVYNNSFYPDELERENKLLMSIGVSYKLPKNIELGLNCGFASLSGGAVNSAMGSILKVSAKGIFYNLQCNYHFLSALSSRPLRFDVYPAVKVGGMSKFWDFETKYREHFLEAGAGIGVGVYFTKNIGIYGEAMAGRFYNNWFSWNAGVNFRF